ncbi:hypothetical protein BH20ACT18_BH20ACT18_03700 [soil metagenome]
MRDLSDQLVAEIPYVRPFEWMEVCVVVLKVVTSILEVADPAG